MSNVPFIESDYTSTASSATPAEQASDSLMSEAKSLNHINNLLNGSQAASQGGGKSRRKQKKRRSFIRKMMRGGGRTFDIPFPTTPFVMPGPTYNNAWYVGEPCVGNHCGVAITPTVSDYAVALQSETPGASTQFPTIDRLGNSPSEILPGIQPYQGTELNYGPFAFNCVGGGGMSRRNKMIKKKSQLNKKSKLRGEFGATSVFPYFWTSYCKCKYPKRVWDNERRKYFCANCDKKIRPIKHNYEDDEELN